MTQDYVALMDELKTGQRDKITVTPAKRDGVIEYHYRSVDSR